MKSQVGNIITGIGIYIGTFFLLFLLTGCGDSNGPGPSRNSGSGEIVLNGSGATFPSPVYNNWCYNYSESTENRILVNYQGIGSGAGINQLKEGTVDFAGSDAPLTEEEQKKGGYFQFPMLAGGIVVVVNLPGIKDGELRLSQVNLVNIFLGKIKKWNDPVFVKDNPELNLPDLPVTIIHRSDSSGTSFLFTNYLAKISEEWKKNVGEGKSVNWPVGIGGQKNTGVCNNISNIKGSIGYTEYTYAVECKLTSVSLQNAMGQYIKPSESSFTEALRQIEWEKNPGLYVILTNASGEKSYPLMGITYILYRSDLEPAKKDELQKYFDWCFESGKKAVVKMHYISIPDSIVTIIKKKTGQLNTAGH